MQPVKQLWRVIGLFALLGYLLPVSAHMTAHHLHHAHHKHVKPHHGHRTHSRFLSYHAAPATSTLYGRAALVTEIQRAIQQVDTTATIGVEVRSMKQGDVLYRKNPQVLFTPASTLKILTAEAALLFLGPDYRFTTRVLTDAKRVNGGILEGNLYLVHGGDPTLTWYDLTDLMVALKSQQIHAIKGNIYIDNSAYNGDTVGPGWMGKDRTYCYAAPISASIINHNCLLFSIVPAKQVNRPAVVVESPRYFYSAIKNEVITRSPAAHNCHVAVKSEADNTIDLAGCLPRGHYSRSASVVIMDVPHYNESLLKSLFKSSHIVVGGNVMVGTAPAGLFELATHQSKPLHSLINEMLKKSDNIIAGSLFKKMGQVYTLQPGNWQNGRFAVSEILRQQIKVDTSGLKTLDGSGLSRDNQVSPAQLMRVLDFAFHNENTSYEFISSLPVAGQDGTLKNRLKNVKGRVRAKTGTMSDSGVISLAGYAITRDREPVAFVILVNGHKGYVWKYREMEDAIATALVRFKRG